MRLGGILNIQINLSQFEFYRGDGKHNINQLKQHTLSKKVMTLLERILVHSTGCQSDDAK